MHVVHESGGTYAITDIIRLRIVVCEQQILNRLAATEKTSDHAFDRRPPHVATVALEHASGDPGDENEDVGELVRHVQRTP
jgi:hypothetical protein